MRRLSSVVVAATLIVSMLQVGIPAARAGDEMFYLALGTSLAVGFQPNHGRDAEGLRRRPVAADAGADPGPQPAEPRLSRRDEPLDDHRDASALPLPGRVAARRGGRVPASASRTGRVHHGRGRRERPHRRMPQGHVRIDRACAADLLPRLQHRLTHIVDALAAAGPGVPIVGMTYYDPLLGLWGLVPGGRALARADARVWADLNATFTTAYGDAGASVADVATTFQVDDFTDTVVVPGRGELPVNVANACRWTWFCSPRFAGDPHANAIGYRKIADTFEQEIVALLT